MTPRERGLLVWGTIVLAVALQAEYGDRVQVWNEAHAPTHELTPVPDSLRHGWAETARCLTGDTAWRGTRVFVGGRPPAGWPSPEDSLGRDAGGVNPALNALWVRRLAIPTVSHQMTHLRLWPRSHPAFAFGGIQEGRAPLCNLTVPGVRP